MTGPDGGMWDVLRPLLKNLDPIRVENSVLAGTPDVEYIGGWIELKYAPRWPPKEGPLRLPHFTTQQRRWLRRRRRAGGRAFVLLKVGDHWQQDWLLFDGKFAAARLGEATKEELVAAAIARWLGKKPQRNELQVCLTTYN